MQQAPQLPGIQLTYAVTEVSCGFQVVDSWSLDRKLQFVTCVTGGQRPCPMGPEVLNIVLAFVPPYLRDQTSMLQRLPLVRAVHNIQANGSSKHGCAVSGMPMCSECALEGLLS